MSVFHPTMFVGSAFWQPAGEAMLEFLVSGSAVTLIFMLIRRMISRLPASFRYAAASAAVAALVGLAGYHVCEHWPVTPSPTAAVTGGASPSVPSGSRAVSPSAVSAPATTTPTVVSSATTSRFTWEAMKPRFVVALPALWLFGAPLTGLFVGLGWTGAARLRRQSTPLMDETLLSRFAGCQALMQVKGVGLAVCERIAAPIVVGVVRPMILLPPALLTSLSCEQWEMILLHELAHVRRLDNLVNLLQRAVETVLFFHPGVWWASRWMRLEREHCCDAAVLRLGTSPQSYAETLALLALPGIAPQLATAAMANHELLTRMRHILGTEDLPMTISWKKLSLAAVMFAVVGGLVANDWSSSAQHAAAEESRQKELEETILRRMLIDMTGEGHDLAYLTRSLAGQGRSETLRDVIDQIERLKMESGFEASAEDLRALAFADQLVQRLQRLKTSEEAIHRFTDLRLSTERPAKPHWSADQMLGPPDVMQHSDNPKAWAARNPDQGEEWVRLGYAKPIKAAAILIYESFNPGAVTSVRILGDGISGEEIVWKATGGPSPMQTKNVLAIPIQELSKTRISAVNIHLDERRTPGWNEIDAVGLVDAETGETHWAKTAEASSTYASVDEPKFTSVFFTMDQSQKPAWSAEQVIGPPDVPEHTDHRNAWAAKEPDNQQEWIQVEFGGDYKAAALVIHESFNPGAIKRVEVDSDGSIDEYEVRPHRGERKHVSVVPLRPSSTLLSAKIYVDEPAVPGWNEIDAVGLIDADTGEMHWATKAKASSSFSDVRPPQEVPRFVDFPVTQSPEVPNWHPRQATGAPNVPTARDDGRAWASSSQDGQQEWLELTYDPPVEASLLLVYESYQPGALVEVQVAPEGLGMEPRMTDSIGPAGRKLVGVDFDVVKTVFPYKSIWKGRDSVRIENGKGVAAIAVPAGTGKICRVRLTLDSPDVPGWNEIDAVGLLNGATGQVQWASDAKASSWFGEQRTVDANSHDGGGSVSLPSSGFVAPILDVPVERPMGVGSAGESSAPNWHPSHATGPPNVKQAGDNPKAWASATPDGQQEWLELTYDPPVLASSMSIYESYNPGSITDVQIEEVDPIVDALPAGKDGFRTLMKGSQLYKQGRNGLGITMVTVKTNIRPIRRVRLTLDSQKVQGWNEIDAVGLLSTTGEMHWAKEAKASSWYGESGPGGARAQGGIEIRQGPSLEVAQTTTKRSLRIDVDAGGVASIEDEEVTDQELATRLAEGRNLTVTILAARRAPYRAVQELIDRCRSSNVENLSVGTLDESDSSTGRVQKVSLEGIGGTQTIWIERRLLLRSKSLIKTVEGHDPNRLSINVKSPREVTVEGLKEGESTFTVTDEFDKRTQVRVVVLPMRQMSQIDEESKVPRNAAFYVGMTY